MVQEIRVLVKDPGIRDYVEDSYPTKIVGGVWEGSFDATRDTYVALNHIVPTGHQLKLLFLRIYTQEAGGARFSILETNPSAIGNTGTVEAYPVVGSVPPFAPIAGGAVTTEVRDRPFLEAAGAEVLRGGLRDPIHVFEGSIDFRIHDTPAVATGARYGLVWAGLQDLLTPAHAPTIHI